MFRTLAILVSAIGFVAPASGQVKEQPLPANTIDCTQFKKTGAQEWSEVGTAVFNLGSIRDIHLTNQPVTPRYFKFDGIDLDPVVEQKCGGVPAGSTEGTSEPTQPVVDEAARAPKTEAEQDNGASPSVPTSPVQAPLGDAASQDKPAAAQTAGECGDRKAVYIADGAAEPAGATSSIEIAFNKNVNGEEIVGLNSEFTLRGYINDKLEWAYKGKIIQGKFIFAATRQKRQADMERYMFAPQQASLQAPVIIAAKYIQPTRKGGGEGILYLGGLHTVFASKEAVQRFRFEGSRPSGPLPEAFYFDRCE